VTQSDEVQQYFTRSALSFDALYAEGRMHPLVRFLNRQFRRDIYERFLLTMDHVRQYRLETAFDVGCGSGRYAVALAGMGLTRVLGIDFSPSMIEAARSHARGAPEAVCEFVCADFMQFDPRESFDVVIAMGVFDYVADPVPMLSKMRSLARHSVVASFPSISLYRTPIRKLRYRLKRCPVYFYDRPGIDRLAAEATFSRHEVIKIVGAGMDYFVSLFR